MEQVKEQILMQDTDKMQLTLKAALEISRRAVHIVTTRKHINLHKLWRCYEKYKDTQNWEMMVKSYRDRTGDFDIGAQDFYTLIDWMMNTKDRWQNI